MKKVRLQLLFVLVAAAYLPVHTVSAQLVTETNMDESKVPPYTLPDPLLMADGKKVTTTAQWNNIQRPYIYHLFEENIYGILPTQKLKIRYAVRELSKDVMDGKATRKQVRVYLHPTDTTIFIDLLIYLPDAATKPVPVFVGYNFGGNQSIQKDTNIFLTASWRPKFKGVEKPTDSTRGTDSGWPVEEILEHGYGLVTAYYADIEPDNSDGWKTGIRSSLQKVLHIQPDQWCAIGAWAWGLSRIMDYLQQDKMIDASKIALVGHSRLGKASLWAGASDTRFSLVVSNESGEGGAALSKRFYGETIKNLNDRFPHWFIGNYRKYNDNAAALPVDQHMLLSLIAPRPLYVASAVDDQWSDPKGEFLSAYFAGPVYSLFGKTGIATDSMPALQHPTGGNSVRYHIRSGSHAITLYDWMQYLQFADEQWKKK